MCRKEQGSRTKMVLVFPWLMESRGTVLDFNLPSLCPHFSGPPLHSPTISALILNPAPFPTILLSLLCRMSIRIALCSLVDAEDSIQYRQRWISLLSGDREWYRNMGDLSKDQLSADLWLAAWLLGTYVVRSTAVVSPQCVIRSPHESRVVAVHI